MTNIAAFVDVKDGKLSAKSIQLVLLIQEMKRVNSQLNQVFLYTIDSVETVVMPSLGDVQLTAFKGISELGILTVDQLKSIAQKLSADQVSCLLGYKNLLNDQLFPTISAHSNLPLLSQITGVQLDNSSITLKQSIFSGKASSAVSVSYASLFSFNNAYEFGAYAGDFSSVQVNSVALEDAQAFQITGLNHTQAGINLAEASFVVGAGRGLKDPGNWNIIEDLATKIGAATACSKPVSDVDWRPHSEHVGQTGIKIAPQLYIACGISGAIQHLAGVNGSKTIIVINNDPEAPFFKYADYGIVGDVFDVVPELVKKL